MLLNFLSYLDIFLNEERKILVSYNHIPPSEVSWLKKTQSTVVAPKRRGGANMHSHNLDEKNNREKFNFLTEFMKNKVPIPATVLEQREINQKLNRKPILSCIESHFIFSVIWSNCIFVSEGSRVELGEFLIDIIGKYVAEEKIERGIFANGFIERLERLETKSHNFMEFFYDMHNCRWTLWKETKLPDYPIISSNYHSNLEYSEIVRLNPLAADIQSLKKFMGEKEIQMTALPNLEEQQFVMNDISKKCKYFLDYLVGYNRTFLVTSNSQAGKTTVIRYKVKKMLEQNICKVINISLTANTKPETVNTLNK